MPVKVIKSYDEFRSVISGERPVVIDFEAAWCGPCRFLSPAFEKFSDLAEFVDIDFYKVDVDGQPQITEEMSIRSVPTVIAFLNGSKLDQVVGANSQAILTFLRRTKSPQSAL